MFTFTSSFPLRFGSESILHTLVHFLCAFRGTLAGATQDFIYESLDDQRDIDTVNVQSLQEADLSFYGEGMGFAVERGGGSLVLFDAGPIRLAALSRDLLDQLAGPGTYTVDGGDRIAISFGVASRQEVDEIMERAKESGAQIVKEAEENAFAGYSGVFRDPFGNRWHVGFNVEFYRKK